MMAKIYYRLIKAGDFTIDQVPARYKEAVQKLMDTDEETKE